MEIRIWVKERGISRASCCRQIFNRNRTKRIRRGSIPTVKLIFASQIYVQLNCIILVIFTSFIGKVCATLWSLFLLSKGKWAASMSPPWRTQTGTCTASPMAHTPCHQKQSSLQRMEKEDKSSWWYCHWGGYVLWWLARWTAIFRGYIPEWP